jgi:hypothetical protein
MMAAQPPRLTRIQHQVLGQHLGLEGPAFRQVLQLAAQLVEVVGRQARIDRLGVFLQDPDRAAGLAQQNTGLPALKVQMVSRRIKHGK